MLEGYGIKGIVFVIMLAFFVPQVVAQDAAPAAGASLIDIKSVHAGDVYVFWMRKPREGFVGYQGPAGRPNIWIPKKMEDYEQLMLRVSITSVNGGINGNAILAKVDEVNAYKRTWREGVYTVEFKVQDGIIDSDLDDGLEGFPFCSYPSVATLRSERQERQYVAKNGKIIKEVYDAPNYETGLVSVDVGHYVTMQREPERLAARFTDAMVWKIGSPFFTELVRRDADGNVELECIMVGKESTQISGD